MLSNFSKLFIGGFTMGWGPCLAYTLPLLLPYIGATKRNWKEGLKVGVLFSVGRLIALALLGGLATVAFCVNKSFLPPQMSGGLDLIVGRVIVTIGSFFILCK